MRLGLNANSFQCNFHSSLNIRKLFITATFNFGYQADQNRNSFENQCKKRKLRLHTTE